MVTLYIIGAGCSTNYDQSKSPVLGLIPPVNNDFFKMAKKVIDFYDLNNMWGPINGLDHLIADINRLYGYERIDNLGYETQVLNDDRLKLEDVMTFYDLKFSILDRDILGDYSSRDHRTRPLNNLLAFTICEALAGPVCNKHLLLANIMQKDDVVWSFNYDLLMDNALYYKGMLTDSGYKIRFDYIFAEGNWI